MLSTHYKGFEYANDSCPRVNPKHVNIRAYDFFALVQTRQLNIVTRDYESDSSQLLLYNIYFLLLCDYPFERYRAH